MLEKQKDRQRNYLKVFITLNNNVRKQQGRRDIKVTELYSLQTKNKLK